MGRNWLWVLFIVLVLALATELTYYFGWYKNFLVWSGPKSESTVQINPVADTNPPIEKPIVASNQTVSDPGVTWITPKKLDDLGLIKLGDNVSLVDGYWQVADLQDGGQLILAMAEPNDPSGTMLLRFQKDGLGNYFYLLKNSGVQDNQLYSAILNEKVKINYETAYQTVSAPDFLTVGGETFKKSYGLGLFSDLTTNSLREVGTSDYGKLYQVQINPSEKDTTTVMFDLKLADSTYQSYSLKFPFITDDEIAQITWSDGTVNKDKFTAESYTKCASSASENVIVDTSKIDSRLKEAGKTTTGDKIYTVSTDDPIMAKAYENYKVGREKDILAIADFAKQKPVFVWQDKLGTYIIFTNRNFGGLAECGKPVIYLYPENAQEVVVKLGANITKSEPVYDNGWKVLADPSGQLTVDGKTYNSLFWEGTGQVYPAVNAGFIVAQKDIEKTLKDQVLKLGLNEKESADFMAFWLPKMPKTPYVRLTWFGTKDVNRLAPLTISPAPDTIIRIFLDFEGLAQPITIKPQILNSIPRKGFTVIEWGGLL